MEQPGAVISSDNKSQILEEWLFKTLQIPRSHAQYESNAETTQILHEIFLQYQKRNKDLQFLMKDSEDRIAEYRGEAEKLSSLLKETKILESKNPNHEPFNTKIAQKTATIVETYSKFATNDCSEES
jgi:hypothetical protein